MRRLSISSIQFERKKKEFTEILCKKGIEPNSFELNRMLTEYFDNHTMGMPFYAPIKQKPYEESSKADYNHNFSTFKEDIETIYEADIEANNKAVAMQEYYDTEKVRVLNALSKLELRIKNISEALKTTSQVKQHVQVFDDLYSVEFYGDTKRNIPYTTAFVDLLQKKLYTDKTHYQVNKISIHDAKVKLSGFTQFTEYRSKGKLENILNDTLDSLYTVSAKSPNEDKKTLQLDIDLGKMITFNTVMFSFSSTKELPCELYLSDDEINYIPVYDVTNRDYIEWTFNEKTARYMRIICHKSEPDGMDSYADGDTVSYDYNFMFKNISIAKESFESKSIFVSKVIDFDDLVSTIKLDATDMIFNHTRIDYFIGFDNEHDKIGWDAIENHKDYKLFMFEKRHKILNSHIEEFGHKGELLNLFRIYRIPDGVNRNSIKLTAGYNMWHVKRYNRKDGDKDDNFSIVSGDFSEHVAKCNMTHMFMDCENYDHFNIQTNVLYTFTQYVSLDSSQNVFDKFIKVTDTTYQVDANAEIRVFLNGYEIAPTNKNRYSFALKKGVNKIQLAVYTSNSNVSIKFLYHNLNFKELTNNVFGCTPMKYTNNLILDRMVGDTYEFYTIKDNWIYIKCDPNAMIYSDLDDMGYFCSYYCLREDMRNYFPDGHLKFRIMAVLHSNDRNVSPELCNYRLTGR